MFLVLGCSSGSVVGLHSRFSFENGKGVDKIGYAIDWVRRVRSSPARTVGVVGRCFEIVFISPMAPDLKKRSQAELS